MEKERREAIPKETFSFLILLSVAEKTEQIYYLIVFCSIFFMGFLVPSYLRFDRRVISFLSFPLRYVKRVDTTYKCQLELAILLLLDAWDEVDAGFYFSFRFFLYFFQFLLFEIGLDFVSNAFVMRWNESARA